MSRTLLRFLHAADFQLHQLPTGVVQLPDELRKVIINATLDAARNVFDAALANAVDFVVLSGNIIDVEQASPSALRFLYDQFKRLEARNIRVYWAGGPRDLPARWPAGLPLPENVHLFTADKVETLTYARDGKPLAVVTGMSNSRERFRAGDLRAARDGVFTIAALHGDASVEELNERGIHYWALGGRETAETLSESPAVIRYCGAPQGFTPQSNGKHGATLVSVDEANEVRLQTLACDVLRWQHEQLTATSATSDEELFQLLCERTTQLISGSPDRHLLVRWSLIVDEYLGQQLQKEGLAAELTARLQKHFANRKPHVWTYQLAPQTRVDVPAELYEEDTILGDFLRSLRDYRQSKGKSLNLDAMISKEIADAVAAAAIRAEDSGREQLLRDVAALGIEMLSGAAMVDSNTSKIQFRSADGAGGSKSMTLKHDGASWEAQQDMAALLDEELTS
jgi:DNA repair exonuclease SbcCD nuclease subunit